tara:strand:- start:33 stop:476 length:444 start_codon:yes stop_codon:yes gene_type:complete
MSDTIAEALSDASSRHRLVNTWIDAIDEIHKRFIGLGEGVREADPFISSGKGPIVGMSEETAEKIARKEEIDEKDLRKLVDALRLQGYGVQEYAVRVRLEVETTVRAQSTDEAEGMVKDMGDYPLQGINWSDFEAQSFDPLWAEPTE